jgi:hypothetical protein
MKDIFDGTNPISIMDEENYQQNTLSAPPVQNGFEERMPLPQNPESSLGTNSSEQKDIFEGTNPISIMDDNEPSSTPQNSPQNGMSPTGIPSQETNGTTTPPQNETGILNNMINLAKALPASVGANVDLLGMLYNLLAESQNLNTEQEMNMSFGADKLSPEQKQNYLESTKVPTVGSLEQTIEEGLGAEHTPAYEGTKFAASLAGPGGVAKLLKKAAPTTAKALSSIGSLRPADIAAAGAAGATMEATKDKVGELGSLGLGLGAGIGTQAAGSIAPGIMQPRKAIRNLLAKQAAKKFKSEIYEAAKDINVPLPLVALTDSKMIKFLNENISKYPVFGERIKDAFQETTNAFQKGMGELLDSVGPLKNDQVKGQISKLYEKAREALPEDAMINTNKIVDRIKEIKEEFKALSLSEDTKKLFTKMEEIENGLSIKSSFGNFSPPIPVKLILNQKAEINRMLKDTDQGVKLMFNHLNDAFRETLEDYGKINPEWSNTYKKAEKYYATYAKRKKIDQTLEGKLNNPISEEVNYPSFIKSLKTGPKKEILEKSFGKENYPTVEKFINVARSMHKGSQSVNTSASATINSVFAFGASVGATIITMSPTLFAANMATLKGISSVSKLLVDKDFVELISKFAKEPTTTTAEHIEEFVKKRSGVSLQTLNHKMNSLLNKKEEKPTVQHLKDVLKNRKENKSSDSK